MHYIQDAPTQHSQNKHGIIANPAMGANPQMQNIQHGQNKHGIFANPHLQHIQHAPTQLGQNKHGIIDLTKSKYTFSGSQLEKLEESFQAQRYPSQEERAALAQKLGLECAEKNVKSWFQNRRVKAKRTGN